MEATQELPLESGDPSEILLFRHIVFGVLLLSYEIILHICIVCKQ